MMHSGDGQMPNWLVRLLCRRGFHDFSLAETVIGSGGGQQVDKVECRRGGQATTRVGR